MAIKKATDNKAKINAFEAGFLKEAGENRNVLAELYNQGTSIYENNTDRNVFMDFMLDECVKRFKWNREYLDNREEVKKRLYTLIFAGSEDPMTRRPRGVIPFIASFLEPKHINPENGEKHSDLEQMSLKLRQEEARINELATEGEARTNMLQRIEESGKNGRYTPEVFLTLTINAKREQLRVKRERYESLRELVRASGLSTDTYFVPERPSKSMLVAISRQYDDNLGLGDFDLDF